MAAWRNGISSGEKQKQSKSSQRKNNGEANDGRQRSLAMAAAQSENIVSEIKRGWLAYQPSAPKAKMNHGSWRINGRNNGGDRGGEKLAAAKYEIERKWQKA